MYALHSADKATERMNSAQDPRLLLAATQGENVNGSIGNKPFLSERAYIPVLISFSQITIQ